MNKLIPWLAARRKAIASAITVVLVWLPAAQIDHFQARDWRTLAVGLAGVFGVHAVANDPLPDAQPPAQEPAATADGS